MKPLLLAILSALTPAPPVVNITVHDAAGRTIHVQAHYNSFTYNAGTITLDITTDTIMCGSFE